MMWLLPLMLAVALTGCMQTTYKPYTAQQKAPDSAFQRVVAFRVDDAFYRHSPDCVIVWPGSDPRQSIVEEAVAGALASKVPRVIDPRQRDRLARDGAYDLDNAADRQAFARKVRCAAGLEITEASHRVDYALVWAQHRVALDLALRHEPSGEILWRAHHVARRGDGGVPLSPVSVVFNAAQAGMLSADAVAMSSTIDEALRSMLKTLPDLR